MSTRPAWGLLAFGAMVVVALLLSPLWLWQLEDYIKKAPPVSPFPDAFYALPSQAQDQYLSLYSTNRQMAIDMVAARLAEPIDVEEANLPVIDPNPQLVQELLRGNFVRLDAIRGAEGTATLYRLSDGRTIVRLQSFNAIGGPDLRVLLSAYGRPATREELDQTRQLELDLGPLKGTQGNQNYEITDPAFNVDNYVSGSVVIYSARYQIVFSFAPLSAPQ